MVNKLGNMMVMMAWMVHRLGNMMVMLAWMVHRLGNMMVMMAWMVHRLVAWKVKMVKKNSCRQHQGFQGQSNTASGQFHPTLQNQIPDTQFYSEGCEDLM